MENNKKEFIKELRKKAHNVQDLTVEDRIKLAIIYFEEKAGRHPFEHQNTLRVLKTALDSFGGNRDLLQWASSDLDKIMPLLQAFFEEEGK